MNYTLPCLLIFLAICLPVRAQQLISGTLLDDTTEQPVEGVSIVDRKTGEWTLSPENGTFEIQVDPEDFELHFKILGKEELVYTPENLDHFDDLTIYLHDHNLRLDEVILVSDKRKFSEITLEKEALDESQAFSVYEVLQQLPGQSVSEFQPNGFKNMIFRTADVEERLGRVTNNEAFGNKAFGTAILINDIPMSNNENMQSYVSNPDNIFHPSFIGFNINNGAASSSVTNANFGVDLREIPTSTIEKIEVIQGIPSVKYGDLTSGVVNIETRAGETPYMASVSLQDGTTQFNFGKGFRLSEKMGVLNLNFDFLNADADPRNRLDVFNRYNFGMVWSISNPLKTVKNTLNLGYNYKKDNAKLDPDDKKEQKTNSRSRGISLKNNFKWKPEKAWADHLSLNFSLNYTEQFSHTSGLINNAPKIIPLSMEEGVSVPAFTPTQYREVREVDGKPISGFIDLGLEKSLETANRWKHHILIGASLRYSDNLGKGRIADAGSFDTALGIKTGNGGSGRGFRPYDFSEEVRAQLQYGFYLQDDISRNWDNKTLVLSSGIRYDIQNGYSTLSPRVNASFSVNDIRFRGGAGLTSKAPSLNMVYTGPRYHDTALNLTPGTDKETFAELMPDGRRFALLYTDISEGDNTELKPSRGFRSEVGIDYNSAFAKWSLTGYYNRLYDGFTTEQYWLTSQFPVVEINRNTVPYEYAINGYAPGEYFGLNRQVNGYESTDKGIELMANFKKIPSLGLQFGINGAYVQTESSNSIPGTVISSRFYAPVAPRKRWGVFKGAVSESELFRLGANIRYHLSDIGLLISLRSEHFFIDKTYTPASNRYPYAYMDTGFNISPIPQEDQTDADRYGDIFNRDAWGEELINDVNTAYHNFHLRISKDFLNGFRFDFYVSNFLNLKPTYVDNDGDVNDIKITPLAFGSKISYQF